jgi:hypothetical protein
MKRTISSKWTLPVKIVNFVLAAVPIVWIAAMLINFRNPMPEDFSVALETLTVLLGVSWSAFFLWANSRLKFVSIDDDNLYVSRLLVEKTIPLTEIKEVFLTKIGAVWVCVRFGSPTAFGGQIFFQPTIERSFLASFQRFHPIVEELTNHVNLRRKIPG